MKKFLLLLIALVMVSVTGHSDNKNSSEIAKSEYPDGIPSKVVVHDENGNKFEEFIVFDDLNEEEIKELYNCIQDYLHDKEQYYDEYFERDEKTLKASANYDVEAPVVFKDKPTTYKPTSFTLEPPVYAKGRKKAILNMPVLSQGDTDTCATFASTAAVDMVEAAGSDKYSVYRSLMLGKAISKNEVEAPMVPSRYKFDDPWNGAYPPCMAAQYMKYGLVNDDDESVEDHGLRQAGFSKKDKDKPFKRTQLDSDFKKLDNLECYIAFEKKDIKEKYKTETERMDRYIQLIKNELDKGNVVLITIDLLTEKSPNSLWNENGMSATTTVNDKGEFILDLSVKKDPDNYNTWDIFKDLAQTMKMPKYRQKDAAHTMVIIGYSDNKKAKRKGVFILRNSWGKNNGIGGNNFITYEYLYTFGCSVVAVGTKPKPESEPVETE